MRAQFARFFAGSRIANEPQNTPGDLAPLEQHEVHRNLRDLPRREAHDEEPSLPRRRAQRGLGERPAHGVVDHVRARSAREGFHALFQVFTGVVDAFIRTVLATHRELLGSGSRRDHPRAEELADLDRREAHAPRRAEYEQRLTRAQVRAINERVPRRRVREQRGGAHLEPHPLRELHRGQLGHDDRLGEGSVEERRGDAVAHGERGDAVAQRGDHTRGLAPPE